MGLRDANASKKDMFFSLKSSYSGPALDLWISTFIVILSFEPIPKILFNVGTFILITFGNASVAQSVLSLGNKGDFFSVNWG